MLPKEDTNTMNICKSRSDICQEYLEGLGFDGCISNWVESEIERLYNCTLTVNRMSPELQVCLLESKPLVNKTHILDKIAGTYNHT